MSSTEATPRLELSWRPVPGAREYRLDVVDLETEETLRSVHLEGVESCTLELSPDLAGHRLGGALFTRARGRDEWTAFGPTAGLSETPTAVAKTEPASPINRVEVFDSNEARIVFDEVLFADAGPSVDDLDMTHRLVVRSTPWTGAAWGEPSEWELPRDELLLGPPHPPSGRIGRVQPVGLLLLLTIDTEGSLQRLRDPDPDRVVDLLVFGGEHGLGIDLHMDLLEHFGATGSFFLDVLMEYRFGRRSVERIVERILTRGHEIQLHLHSDHLRHARDESVRALATALGRDDPVQFRCVMELAIDLFEQRVGNRPIAYRAGGYRISDIHLDILRELGIRIDASVQTWFHSRVSDWMRARTQPFWIGDHLLEVPASWYLRQDGSASLDPRAYAPSPGVGPGGCVTSMPSAGSEPHVATIVSHSFQLLRSERIADPDFRAAWIGRLTRNVPQPDRDLYVPNDNYVFTVNDPVRDEEMSGFLIRELRAVAERPDARCVTYAELEGLATERGWWRGPRALPVDPVPTFDAARGRQRIRYQRLYSAALSETLSAPTSAMGLEQLARDADLVLDTFDEAIDADPREALRQRIDLLEPDESLKIAAPVLACPAGLDPPLGTLLFPQRAGARLAQLGPGFDVATLTSAVGELGGFVSTLRRVIRPSGELELLRTHGARFAGLDPLELRTHWVLLTVKRGSTKVAEPTDYSAAVAHLIELARAHGPYDRAIALDKYGDGLIKAGAVESVVTEHHAAEEQVDLLWWITEVEAMSIGPIRELSRRAYNVLRPGGDALVAVASPGRLSPTTVLVTLLQAGFEIINADRIAGALACRLVRPFELEDIDRAAGRL